MPHAEIAPGGVDRLAQYARLAGDLNLVRIDATLWIAVGEGNGNLYFLAFLLDLFDDKLRPRAELRLAGGFRETTSMSP